MPHRILKALTLAVVAALGWLAEAAPAEACPTRDFCQKSGRCVSVGQVTREARATFGPQGWRVSRVRLVAGPCLVYKVVLTHDSRGSRVVYWNVTGGRR